MKRHMELRHSAQIKAKAEKANEITILATPCLELGHDEQLNDYEPTKKDEPLNKKQKKQQKAKPEGFTKTKNSRTETVSGPPKTPEKSINMSFSNMSAPASIILGIDDHPNVSPIKQIC